MDRFSTCIVYMVDHFKFCWHFSMCRVNVKCQQRLSDGSTSGRLAVSIASKTTLNVNITSKLLEQYWITKDNWTEEYYTLEHRKYV